MWVTDRPFRRGHGPVCITKLSTAHAGPATHVGPVQFLTRRNKSSYRIIPKPHVAYSEKLYGKLVHTHTHTHTHRNMQMREIPLIWRRSNIILEQHRLLLHSQHEKGFTFVVRCLPAELFNEFVDLRVHHHLVLIPNAILTQEVKLDMVTSHALHILHLPHTTHNGTSHNHK